MAFRDSNENKRLFNKIRSFFGDKFGDKLAKEILTEVKQTVGGVSANSAIEVLTEYPTTNASKAGQEVWYNGDKWIYLTQDLIDSKGMNGLVSVGFPMPVNDNRSFNVIFGGKAKHARFGSADSIILSEDTYYDFLGFSNVTKQMGPSNYSGFTDNAQILQIQGGNVTEFKNANLLVSLENFGTQQSLSVRSFGLQASVINDLFTQLPSTTKTATINVANNPGSATCDPTIATAKGYTVVTS